MTQSICFTESSFLNFHESDCELRGSPPCDSLLSLSTEKILVCVLHSAERQAGSSVTTAPPQAGCEAVPGTGVPPMAVPSPVCAYVPASLL